MHREPRAPHGGDDPEEALKRRVVVAHQCGVPADPSSAGSSAAAARAPARPARCASTASWSRATPSTPTSATGRSIETPGHAPSHICLYQPERRLLISGDHLLGRVSLYFDVGYTPDPVAEFLDSLDKVERLDARLALAGHGRPFTDVGRARRGQPRARAAAPRRRPGRARRRPRTAYEIAQEVYGERFTEPTANWLLTKTLAWLTHLERRGLAHRAGEAPGALVGRRLDFPHADRRATGLGRALLLVRVLPAEDRRGRAQPRPRAGGALPAGADLRVGHLRRRRQHRPEAQDRRHRVLDQGRARPRGDGPLHLRRAPRSASCARRSTSCATPASRTCSRCAATRRRARPSGRPPRAASSTRAS